jgi:hypothetical protein
MDMRFGTWTVKSLYSAGTLKTVASKLAKQYKRSDGMRVVVSQQMTVHFSVAVEMLIIT